MKNLFVFSFRKKEKLPKVELISLPIEVKKPIVENLKRDFIAFDNWMQNLVKNEHYANVTKMTRAYNRF